MSGRVGIIAGQGTLPFLVARGIRAAGKEAFCVGLRDQWEEGLPAECAEFREAGVLQIGKWIRLFRRAGITEVTMVGRVSKKRMHDPWLILKALRDMPDLRTIDLWLRKLRHDRRSATLLTAVAEDLASQGVHLIDSTRYIPEHLASEGPMGRVQPDARALGDIAFGWPLLEKVGGLDIGQAISVRDRDVIAVEAVEGTDAMIARSGELCRAKGWTLLKSARPGHDMRADVPTIGVQTIDSLAKAGAGCVAVGVGRVILVDKPAVIAAADRAGIAIVGVKG